MVDAHPCIAITHEQCWLARYFEKATRLTREGLVTPDLITRLLRKKRFQKLGARREELERLLGSTDRVSYASIVTELFDRYGKAKGKGLVGDKCPSYVVEIPALHALWPRAKFVHLIRDGRDVALSICNWSEPDHVTTRLLCCSEDRVSSAAYYWKCFVRAGREAGKPLGAELYYELWYESLVASPAKECGALCAFLGVPYDGAMLRFHQGRTRSDPSLDTKGRWLPVTPGLRDWRTQMPAQDVERFEAAAGGLLDELGYARAFPHPRPASLAHAAKIRQLLVGDAKWMKRFGSRLANGVNAKALA
jgi:hypothetical protein